MKKGLILFIGLAALIVGFIGLTRECQNRKKISSSTPVKSNSCVQKTCKQIKNCAEAKYLLKECGLKELDRDGDGIPCENLCK